MIKPQRADIKASKDMGPSSNIEIALLQKDVQEIRDNHLSHMKDDIDRIERKVDKMSDRIWWVLGILIASTLGTLIAQMIT